METKHLIYIMVAIFSTLGGWLGGIMDHGNFLGMWSILLAGIGGFVGVYVGYKIGNNT